MSYEPCSIRVDLALKQGVILAYARSGLNGQIEVTWGPTPPDPVQDGTGWRRLERRAAMVAFRMMIRDAGSTRDSILAKNCADCAASLAILAEAFSVAPHLEKFVDQSLTQGRIMRKKEFGLGLPTTTATGLLRKAYDAYLIQVPLNKKEPVGRGRKKTVSQATPVQEKNQKGRSIKKNGRKTIWVQFVQGGAPGLGKR